MRNPRRLFGLLVASLLATIFALVAVQPARADGWLVLKNFGSGECLQPNPADTVDVGVQLVQEPCNPEVNVAQRWLITSSSTSNGATTVQLQNQSTHGCMDAHGPNADHTPVDTWPCSGISNQKWTFSPFLTPTGVVSAVGNRCLDVTDGSVSDGTPIQIFHCFGGVDNLAQRWLIQ